MSGHSSPETSWPTRLQQALGLATLGFDVFPVRITPDFQKRPVTPNGFKDATQDPSQLEAWWERSPDAAIGMALPPNTAVADLDTYKAQYDPDHGLDLPTTVQQTTGRGGLQLFYRTDGRPVPQLTNVRPGIDTRVSGKGYVVVYEPEAITHPQTWTWAPEWLYGAQATSSDDLVFTVQDHPLWEAAMAGERAWHDAELISYAGHLRKVGNSEADILTALKGTGAIHHDGRRYLDDREGSYERLARSGARYPPGATAPIDGRDVEYVRASDVTMEPVDWLWEHRLPKGHITLYDGPPGDGKSTLSWDNIAIATTGRSWPDGAPATERINCAIFTTEDDPKTTVVPRLAFAGADLSRVLIFTARKDERGEPIPLTLPDDVAALERSWVANDIKLVVFDPLGAWYGKDINSNIDADVRRAMGALFEAVNRLGIVCIGIRHFTKGHQQLALYRGGGSVGAIGQARMGYHVQENPMHPDEVLFVHAKGNLAVRPPTLAFSREAGLIQSSKGDIEVYRLHWEGERNITAQELNVERKGPAPTLRTEAETLLEEMLGDGPRMARDVLDAARARGISEKTLNRARKSLKVRAEKRPVGWALSLPDNIWSEPSRSF